MITKSDLELLKTEEIRDQIDLNIERIHTDVALDKSLCHSALVATQVKYLQRAKSKLPHYFEARCIIPSRAFEQSSSEATACSKPISGESVLELTCGLGVDAMALSKRFKRVVTLERDEILAEVAKENFKRLGIESIEVINSSAEEFLEQCEERFDWIYVDPDRRGADGKKKVLLEDCSPNILALDADLKRVADNLAVKCSPIFDVDEAFRIYAGSRVEVVSVGDECKEVNIYINRCGEQKEMIGALAVGKGEVWVNKGDEHYPTLLQSLDYKLFSHLIIPDVSLQKSRLARKILGEICLIESDNGYGFSTPEAMAKFDATRHLARIEQIDSILEYEPKKARKELATRAITRAEILKRESPYSVAQITKQLKISEGGKQKIAVTKLKNRLIIIILAQ
ncbi:MAG: RsmD family RNA methyltransferase [Rikenellaceae bacterium]